MRNHIYLDGPLILTKSCNDNADFDSMINLKYVSVIELGSSINFEDGNGELFEVNFLINDKWITLYHINIDDLNSISELFISLNR